MPVLPCQLMFGVERGEQIRGLIEDATGEACPCMRGLRCVLLRPQEENARVIPFAV